MKRKLFFCFMLVPFLMFSQSKRVHSDIEEKNIHIVLTYWDEVWSKGNLQGVEDFYHSNAIHGKNFSYDKFKRNVTSTRGVIPDLKVVVDDIFAKGDEVICRVRYTGTHSGKEMFGQEPLNNELNVPGMDIFTIKDGKCVEHQHVADHLEMVDQMGLKLTPAGNDSIAVVNVLKDFFTSFGNWDIEKLLNHITDNYLLIENGEIWDVERGTRYFSENSHRKIDRKNHFDVIRVNVTDSTAYAVYNLKSEITENEAVRTKVWNESAVFRKLNGDWKIELLHSTPVSVKE